MSNEIETDYLIIGGGAMGLAFADVILKETDAHVTIVDRHHQPGGHWNLAYPFVRLHQPSSGYGVESRDLGGNRIDQDGWNEGLLELASVGEILSYYDEVLKHDLLPSGRLSYHSMSEYQGEGQFVSRLSGETVQAKVRRKIVDSTHQHVTVPAMRSPTYQVDETISCVSPDRIVDLSRRFEDYTVIGAGKTGIDTCLWLLGEGVSPDRIRWIAPRDSWLVNRVHTQPDPRFGDDYLKYVENQFHAIDQASDVESLFAKLEAGGNLLRLDTTVQPRMYRCATVSGKEATHLREIRSVIRLGRVLSIEKDEIVLEKGRVPTGRSMLHIDCTADGLEKRASVDVFDGNLITLQSVRPCQQVFSAAFIGHVEAAYETDAVKNRLCKPVPHPDTDLDWLRVTQAFCEAELLWGENPELVDWLSKSRLNWVWRMGPALSEDGTELRAALAARAPLLQAMAQKLGTLMQNLPSQH